MPIKLKSKIVQRTLVAISPTLIKESGTEIGNSLEFDFVVPPPHRLSRAVKADEISVVEPTQPLRLARQSKDN